jgi:ATP synthase protein I
VVVSDPVIMPKPDDRPEEALGRLGEELKAFEAARARSASQEANRSIAEGYRLFAGLIGGVLGGVGLGWLVDRVAGTAPWGIAIGAIVGAGVSVFMAVLAASRISRRALEEAGKLPSVPDDDDE